MTSNLPEHTISPRAIRVWRMTGFFYSFALWLIVIILFLLRNHWHLPTYILIGAGCLSFCFTIVFIFIFPSLRMKSWRYAIDEEQIEIQHGILIITRTLLPMVRVQHVDMEQGPLLRRYQLAEISISTAATTHTIPALEEKDAEQLRTYITNMARLAKEDV